MTKVDAFRRCLLMLLISGYSMSSRLTRVEDCVEMFDSLAGTENLTRHEDIVNMLNKMKSLEVALNRLADVSSCKKQQKNCTAESVASNLSNEIAKNCGNLRRDFNQYLEGRKNDKGLNRNDQNPLFKVAEDIKATKAATEQTDNRLDGIANNMQSLLTETKDNKIKLAHIAQELLEFKTQFLELKRATERPKSCQELYIKGNRASGQYDLYPDGRETPIRVFCDQETDGGGWTVFQRRMDGSVDFYRGWEEYASGFGTLDGEFWLGNRYLSIMTAACCHQMRIDMKSFEGEHRYAKYNRFQIRGQNEQFKLKIGGYSGNAGNSLKRHRGRKFTTKDRDNDGSYSAENCAVSNTGAWWYHDCLDSCLNGEYLHGNHSSFADGIVWQTWKGFLYSLKFTEMKFRQLK